MTDLTLDVWTSHDLTRTQARGEQVNYPICGASAATAAWWTWLRLPCWGCVRGLAFSGYEDVAHVTAAHRLLPLVGDTELMRPHDGTPLERKEVSPP